MFFPPPQTAGDCQNLPYVAVEEISYISTSLERMMSLYSNSGQRAERNSNPPTSTWFHCTKVAPTVALLELAEQLLKYNPKCASCQYVLQKKEGKK